MQTNYSLYMTAGSPGLVYDINDYMAVSQTAEADIPFGAGVIAGATVGETCKVPTATSAAFQGIAMKDVRMQDYNNNGYVANKQYDRVSVMTWGRIWVNTMEAVNVDDPVYLCFDATNKGKFGKSSTSNNFIVNNAKFKTATTAAGLAVVELR